MTAKSRRRKHKTPEPRLKNYKFTTNTKNVVIEAESLRDAQTIFQQTYGYWPGQEKTDDHE